MQHVSVIFGKYFFHISPCTSHVFPMFRSLQFCGRVKLIKWSSNMFSLRLYYNFCRVNKLCSYSVIAKAQCKHFWSNFSKFREITSRTLVIFALKNLCGFYKAQLLIASYVSRVIICVFHTFFYLFCLYITCYYGYFAYTASLKVKKEICLLLIKFTLILSHY